jgi:5-oxoprolinase (ATP-hydrolysing)
MKLLSVNNAYPDAPREAIRRCLVHLTGVDIPLGSPVPSSRIDKLRMGTTVATNALLERNGSRAALVVTQGLEGLIDIGTQARPNIFDLRVARPSRIAEQVVGIPERVRVVPAADTFLEAEDLLDVGDAATVIPAGSWVDAQGRPVAPAEAKAAEDAAAASGSASANGLFRLDERVEVLTPLDIPAARAALQTLYDQGIRSLAVALAHSYGFPFHELAVGALAAEIGFEHVSLSHQMSRVPRLLPRALTACADAYLTPTIKTYLAQFFAGFDDVTAISNKSMFMQSDGTMTRADAFSGYRAVLSGPAGGVVGYAASAYVAPERRDGNATAEAGAGAGAGVDAGEGKGDSSVEGVDADAEVEADAALARLLDGPATVPAEDALALLLGPGRPCLGFDMGGTSTDVSRYAGRAELVQESHTAGVQLQAPQLDISTVAAGGGSVLTFTDGLMHVGPQSASALPGPAAYGNGGPATVTDANVVCGRIVPALFPKVFGPNQDAPLDVAAARAALEALAGQVNAWRSSRGLPPVSVEEAALGYLEVAEEAMARPMRTLTEARGLDAAAHTLACFGAAGGQHACGVSGKLGIPRAVVHDLASVLSAWGIRRADIAGEHAVLMQCSVAEMAGRTERQRESWLREAVKQLQGNGYEVTWGSMGDNDGEDAPLLPRILGTPSLRLEAVASCKYEGSDSAVDVCADALVGDAVPANTTCQCNADPAPVSGRACGPCHLLGLFREQYLAEYGFLMDRPVVVDAVRVRVVGESPVARHTDATVDIDAVVPAPAPALEEAFHMYASDRPAAPGAGMTDSTGGGIPDDGHGHSTSASASASASTPQTRTAPVYHLSSLLPGAVVRGPCILVDRNSTIDVLQDWVAVRAASSTVLACVPGIPDQQMTIRGVARALVAAAAQPPAKLTLTEAELDESVLVARHPAEPLQLSIFSHRFMAVAEQMGRALQRTAVSANIKERLDFSCALFDADGGLVANAPNLPVHLGAMQAAVRAQIEVLEAPTSTSTSTDADADATRIPGATFADGQPESWRARGWRDGDVVLSNHPHMGGSHLPDITVITPVFVAGVTKPVMFVASRGHHADVGGATAGSMPPTSTTLAEEGCAVRTLVLVRGGQVNREGLRLALRVGQPGGTRRFVDNESDLMAQAAANRRGALLLTALMARKGASRVLAYLRHVQYSAGGAVSEVMQQRAVEEWRRQHPRPVEAGDEAARQPKRRRSARGAAAVPAPTPAPAPVPVPEWVSFPVVTDYMDDGTPVRVALSLNSRTGSAKIDFTGTGPQVLANHNAPRAVVASAVIYVLRSLVARPIPLNQGCMAQVELVLPVDSLLNPDNHCAVVGGNVLTSQRVTDVVLKAFRAAADSQGCMNNLTFGTDSFGYYETIAGGAGAGPGWDGASGVHTHMTNTRITDAESMERRYPVLVRQFRLRDGSGGDGAWKGGDGVVRVLEACRGLDVHVLSERRALAPEGLLGGAHGTRGRNMLVRRGGRTCGLSGKCSVRLERGDRIEIHTPGGGGYGASGADREEVLKASAGRFNGETEDNPTALTGGSANKYVMDQEQV